MRQQNDAWGRETVVFCHHRAISGTDLSRGVCNHCATRMVATPRHESPPPSADPRRTGCSEALHNTRAIIEHDGLVTHNPKAAGSNPALATM